MRAGQSASDLSMEMAVAQLAMTTFDPCPVLTRGVISDGRCDSEGHGRANLARQDGPSKHLATLFLSWSCAVLCGAVLQEFCSLGDLGMALNKKRLCPPGSPRPSLQSTVSILRDIADGMVGGGRGRGVGGGGWCVDD